jgi:uncharacterized phage-associated protein
MPYPAIAVANEFLDLALRENRELTQMQVQKLVFFAHGWHLAIYGQPLIDEQVEAWRFGPVIRSLYGIFRGYGSHPISELHRNLRYEDPDGDNGFRIAWDDPLRLELSADGAADAKRLIERVWQVYGGYSAYQLSNMTHQPGTPWHTVVREYEKSGIQLPKGTDIPAPVLKEYFTNLGRSQSA